jgi:hypothetical protein
MKRERPLGWWGRTMLLGAGSALAVGLGGGMVSPALAQTGSAVSASLPTACPGLEALGSCDNNFYVLHTGATGVLGNVLRVDSGTGARTLFATYSASSPQSNYSLLMRPLILLPGSGPSGPSGGGGGGGL